LRDSLTSAAKAAESKRVIAAVNRCATQNQVQHRLLPQVVQGWASMFGDQVPEGRPKAPATSVLGLRGIVCGADTPVRHRHARRRDAACRVSGALQPPCRLERSVSFAKRTSRGIEVEAMARPVRQLRSAPSLRAGRELSRAPKSRAQSRELAPAFFSSAKRRREFSPLIGSVPLWMRHQRSEFAKSQGGQGRGILPFERRERWCLPGSNRGGVLLHLLCPEPPDSVSRREGKGTDGGAPSACL